MPKGRIGRPSDDYKSTVLPLYYIGISLASFSVIATPFKVLFMPSTGIEPISALPAFYQINYEDIWLRERELNPPVRLMRPESNHCFIPLSELFHEVSFFVPPGLFVIGTLRRHLVFFINYAGLLRFRLQVSCNLTTTQPLTNSFISSSINLQPFSLPASLSLRLG